MTIARHRFNNDLRYREATHPNQTAYTPSYVLTPVRLALGGTIDLDPCTTLENPCGAEDFYTVDDDGLAKAWDADRIFVNPPYGKARDPWVARCIEAGSRGAKVILLMPSHTDTRVFHRAAKTVSAVVFIRGRVKFGVSRPNGRQVAASHPSALLVWNADSKHLSVLGIVATMLP